MIWNHWSRSPVCWEYLIINLLIGLIRVLMSIIVYVKRISVSQSAAEYLACFCVCLPFSRCIVNSC